MIGNSYDDKIRARLLTVNRVYFSSQIGGAFGREFYELLAAFKRRILGIIFGIYRRIEDYVDYIMMKFMSDVIIVCLRIKSYSAEYDRRAGHLMCR